ncbi:MAG TPA: GNAT family N-acetyltransferase [Dehalococcoidia bacterium]|nr:GNAT family N-acetyltransferase [Dehalococcoidia bacterium]
MTAAIEYRRKPAISNAELDDLYAAAWPAHQRGQELQPVLQRSLTWIGAYAGARLVGFVYGAWDGAQHAFLLDTTVHPDYRHLGVGTRLVRELAAAAIEAEPRLEWLHVDSDEALMESFYLPAGFRPTAAGLMSAEDMRGIGEALRP